MKKNTVFVECVQKSWDVEQFPKSAFAQDVKRKRKDIQVIRIEESLGI